MNSIINATVLDKIDDYLVDNYETALKLKLKGFKNEITVTRFSFPTSWPVEVFAEDFKKFGFKSSYDLLNTYFVQYDEELSEEQMNDLWEYEYIEIEFSSVPESKYKGLLNSQLNTYRFFLVYENDKLINFRLIYNSKPYFRVVENFDNSKRIDLGNLDTEQKKTAIENLEKIIFNICQKINVLIPNEIDISKFENLNVASPELGNFSSLLSLTTREGFATSAYNKDAKRLKKLFEKNYDEYKYSEKFRKILSEYYLEENDVVIYDSFYSSDWKFDPEDIEYGISQILGAEFTFSYPPETFAHNLFPYIQTELAKQNLELMNIDTFGDSYFFFIANKDEVDTIFELSQIIGIKIQKLKL